MRKYSLLQCYPVGFGSGNWEIDCTREAMTKPQAISYFQGIYPQLGLNNDGYVKIGTQTYTVVECYEPSF